MWNVNSVSYSLDDADANELIETLWNVNMIVFASIIPIATELIETLWNVNLTVPQITADSARINKNIVDCKFFCKK